MPVCYQRMLKLWTVVVLICNGVQSERRGCGTDRLAAYTEFAVKSGKQVVTVAVAQYGLLRNNCSAFVYDQIFAQLPKSEKYVYVLDHFIHSNEIFAGHETGILRQEVSSFCAFALYARIAFRTALLSFIIFFIRLLGAIQTVWKLTSLYLKIILHVGLQQLRKSWWTWKSNLYWKRRAASMAMRGGTNRAV